MTAYEILPDSTRVWIYQASRPFTAAELNELTRYLHQFADRWVSHNKALRSFADVFHNQFVVLMVDESQAGASGCSIDSSVHFLQKLSAHFKIDLFDRLTFAYQEDGVVKTAHKDQFVQLFEQGIISEETLVFDNLVKNKADFEQQWLKPLKESWHANFVG